ncbi:hypothetical protein RB594_008230 [Gaeumannomyces avenae]
MVWEDVEFDADKVPNIKLGLHIAQIVFGFVGWCLEIVVFRADGSLINGNVGWTFAVFFLSIPAWIYLIGAPRSPRARHLAEPHVMVAVDSIYAIIWLSAFATQAAYNTADQCGTACAASKAIVGLGFFVCLFFAVTMAISIYSLKYYQFNGRLPGYDRLGGGVGGDGQNIDPDKAAFSMAPHGGEDAYTPIHGRDEDDRRDDPLDPRDDHGGPYMNTAYNSNSYSSAAAAGHQAAGNPYGGGAGGFAEPDPYGGSVGSRLGRNGNPFDQGRNDNNPFGDADHTGYVPPAHTTSPGPGLHGRVSPNPTAYRPPSAQDGYDDTRPVQFPAGNYDRTLH